jgi:hypothetical protein
MYFPCQNEVKRVRNPREPYRYEPQTLDFGQFLMIEGGEPGIWY